ncbi:MAG: 30S ribosomal protein S16 [Nitriliruptorales bacterium]|nr:30S ribosomal protein S16 [Nitriliruptorales bacterium]
MAVKLRLRREGTKKRPHYRVVAADHRAPRDGRFIEIIGEYHPLDDPSTIRIDNERAVHWLQHGAQPTEAVEKLLRISGAWEEFKPGDAPKRDRSAQPEKQKLNKKARARLEAEAEAKSAPAPAADDAAPADEATPEADASEETPAEAAPEAADDAAEESADTEEVEA